MVQLFEKLDDLKSVFLYGQKIIPIIHNLLDFMKDTVPLLETINNSIAESTSKIPKAKHQINDVTSATELATTEILDIVDAISDNLNEIEKEINLLFKSKTEQIKLIDELKNLLSGNDAAKLKLDELQNKIASDELVRQLRESMSKVRNDAYNITISLQVQDITSQQLAAVNHLIESVQERLSSLIFNLNETEMKELATRGEERRENVSFDPKASYSRETARQELADSLVKENYNASQEEIDKLFS